jgi:hypothetical protein
MLARMSSSVGWFIVNDEGSCCFVGGWSIMGAELKAVSVVMVI